MLHAVLVFTDSADRTSLFARNRQFDNRVIRADFHTFAAGNADIRIDMRPAVDKGNSLFGAVHHARTRKAPAAGVCDHILRLDAGRTGNVNHRQAAFGVILTFESLFAIVAQTFGLVCFFFRRDAQGCHQTIFQDGSVFINTATTRIVIFRTHFNRDIVGCFKLVFVKTFDNFNQNFTPHLVCIILRY